MQPTWFGQVKAILLSKREDWKVAIAASILWQILLTTLMVVLHMYIKHDFDSFGQFESFRNYSLYDGRFHWQMANKTILASPDTAEVEKLMTNVKQLILDKTNQTVNVEYYANSTEALNAYENNKTRVFAGIVFNYNNSLNLTYALRFPSGDLPSTDYDKIYTGQVGCRRKKDDVQKNDEGLQSDGNCTVNNYLFTAFCILQTAIDTAIIREETGVSTFPIPEILVQMLPKAAFLQDTSFIQIMSSVVLVIAFVPMMLMLIFDMVLDKQTKMMEALKMMGLSSSVLRVTYLLVYIFIIIVTTGILAIEFTLLFIQSYYIPMLSFLYGFSTIALAFLFTPFFNKARTAVLISCLSVLLISSPYLILILTQTIDEGTGIASHAIPVYGRWLLCLLSPVAFAMGIDQAIFLDLRGSMAFETASQGQLPLYGPFIMLLADVLLYFTLAVYFDSVIPGEYGPRYKPWFFLTKAYWCPASREQQAAEAYAHQIQLQLNGPTEDEQEGAEVEPVPVFMSNVAITIRNLTKTFEVRKEKTKEIIKAIDGLSLTIYRDQITAILGHNGSGKTTLLNILTGTTRATSGSVRVLGRDVSDPQDVQKMREMTGFCPQDNMLYPRYTCLDHLRIFAAIKGIVDDQVEEEINTVLESVGLMYEKYTDAGDLSGGQKRKLSVAIAVLGDPKIIILDEPTAGMDPYSRRQLWTLLKEKKKGRVILLTTHYMDEADILADRKAVISKGSLRCCGSSLFLKNRFGLGYHLNMVVEPDCDALNVNSVVSLCIVSLCIVYMYFSMAVESHCDTQKVSSMVSSIVSGSEINRMDGKELDITLPYDGVSKFPELFSVLEHSPTAQSLGVKNFGVSMTTLEEVFLRLEEDIDIDEGGNGNKLNDSTKLLSLPRSYGISTGNDQHSAGIPSDTVNYVEGRTLFMQKFRTLCLLRAKNFFTIGRVLGQLILPVILLIGGLVLFKTGELNRESTSQQPLTLSPAMYTKTKTQSNQHFPYNTIPRLLISDKVNSSLSRSVIGNLSTVYEVDQYDDSYYSDMFKLLDQGVSPHYIGAEFEKLTQTGQAFEATYKVMYNDSAKHSIPATIALVNNFLLMGVEMFVQGTADFRIEVISWPWPKYSDDNIVFNMAYVFSVMMVGTCFCIIAGELSVDLATEIKLKIRSQLQMSGLSCLLYWLTYFVVDFIKFFIPMILTIIAVSAIQIPSLMRGEAAFSFLLVCLFFVPSNILYAYLVSYLESTRKFIAVFFYVLMALVPNMVIGAFKQTPAMEIILHYIFCFILPPYNIYGGLYYTASIYQTAYFKNKEDSLSFGDCFKPSSHVPICYLTSIVHIIFFCYCLRKCYIPKSRTAIPASNNDIVDGEDEDVTAERERVRELSSQPPSELPVAMVENLRKQFSDGKVAVRNQTFAVEAGEVFGLLGPNGSGKTITLKMIIADICPDRGKVMIEGYNIQSNPSQAFQAIGYCPQQDALWPDISLKEHLDFFAKIREIPADRVPEVTNFFIDSLKLEEHKTKKVKYLSGGTKRKLSYCLSVLGKPRFVLLDEPSTGMDPQSKILLWNTISKSLKRSERGAILTTHSMEEADKICSRIAIMVNGTMKCLGTSQHLKSKFGNDYSMEIKLNTDGHADDYDDEQLRPKLKRLHDYIKEIFPQAVVMEQFSDRIQYKIPKSNVETLSRTFKLLEQGRAKYDIAEYSFSQSTLEQVFLEVAKRQVTEGQIKDEDEEERNQFLLRLLSEDSPSQQTSTV